MKKSVVVIVILLVVGIFITANYQKIFKSVLPPNPEIVSSKADRSSSRIFDYSIKVKGNVINKGGDGYIVIEAIVHQDHKKWTKTQQLYLKSYQTKNFEIIFDEVKFLSSAPVYDVKTYALGNIMK